MFHLTCEHPNSNCKMLQNKKKGCVLIPCLLSFKVTQLEISGITCMYWQMNGLTDKRRKNNKKQTRKKRFIKDLLAAWLHLYLLVWGSALLFFYSLSTWKAYRVSQAGWCTMLKENWLDVFVFVLHVCVCVCTCYECLTGWRLWLLFFGTIWETNDISSPKASGRQIDTAACLKSGRHNYTGKKRRWCVCTTDECRSKWWMKDPITEINAMGKQYGEREKKRDVHTRQRAHIFTAKQNNYQWLLLVKEMMGMELNLTHFYVL